MPLRTVLLLSLLAAVAPSLARAGLRLNAELTLGNDSNLNNGRRGALDRADGFVAARAGLERSWDFGTRSSLSLQPRLELELHRDYQALDNGRAALQLRYALRGGRGFYAPVLSLSAEGGWQNHAADLRDGADLRLGMTLREAITTRIAVQLRGSLAWRDAENPVFDIDTRTYALEADWRPRERWTIYGGLRRQLGDFVTTGRPDPALVPFFDAVAPDDSFAPGELAFRRAGDAWIAELGGNYRLDARWALDLQTLGIATDSRFGTEYERLQTRLSLLGRF